jgi:hypothetical protein
MSLTIEKIASEIGKGKSTVHRWTQQGCPKDSIEAVRAWLDSRPQPTLIRKTSEEKQSWMRDYRQRNAEYLRLKAGDWRSRNRDHVNATRRRKYAELPPHYARDHELYRKHRLTPDDRASLISSQDGKCVICGVAFNEPDTNDRKMSKPCVDHSHVTGKVRGVLCNYCNVGLGAFRDDVNTLSAAVRYMEMRDRESQYEIAI